MPHTGSERIGRQKGQATMLASLLALKFGPPRNADADAETLLQWSARLLNA